MLLNFADDGPGPVAVLLHGFPMDLSVWEGQAQTMGSEYRVIRPDCGGSAGAQPRGACPRSTTWPTT